MELAAAFLMLSHAEPSLRRKIESCLFGAVRRETVIDEALDETRFKFLTSVVAAKIPAGKEADALYNLARWTAAAVGSRTWRRHLHEAAALACEPADAVFPPPDVWLETVALEDARKQAATLIREAIERMPDPQGRILRDHLLDEIPLRKIAAELGWKFERVRGHYYRGRAQLQDAFADQADLAA